MDKVLFCQAFQVLLRKIAQKVSDQHVFVFMFHIARLVVLTTLQTICQNGTDVSRCGKSHTFLPRNKLSSGCENRPAIFTPTFSLPARSMSRNNSQLWL